jgi:type VI protein secretion system component VasK
MINFLRRIIQRIRYWYYLVFPMFAGARSISISSSPTRVWVTRIVILAIVLGVLTALNNWTWLSVGTLLAAPAPIDRIWLPLFALGLYLAIWLGWWFWRALNSEVETTAEYPEIDAAWSQAVGALEKAGILLHETPLFIILGQNTDGEDALYQAAGVKATVNQVPRDPREPLHVTANREAIYLTCPGTSCLGQISAPAGAEVVGIAPVEEVGEETDPDRTMGLGAKTMAIGELVRNPAVIAQQLVSRSKAPKKLADPEPFKARLRYLCSLISRDRQGRCPINGVLLLMPISATDPKGDPDEFARCANMDLGVMFDAFKMRCPVLALIADLEKLPGFDVMIARLQAADRGRRMGQRFPLVPDRRPLDLGGMIDGGIEGVCQTLFPSLIYKLLREAPAAAIPKDTVDDNAALVRFLTEVRAREDRLSRLLRSSVPAFDEPLLFGGCYLAGTGSDPATQQAFVSGVFKKMIMDQDRVSWTADAIEADSSYRHLAHTVSLILSLAIAVQILALAYLIYKYFS